MCDGRSWGTWVSFLITSWTVAMETKNVISMRQRDVLLWSIPYWYLLSRLWWIWRTGYSCQPDFFGCPISAELVSQTEAKKLMVEFLLVLTIEYLCNCSLGLVQTHSSILYAALQLLSGSSCNNHWHDHPVIEKQLQLSLCTIICFNIENKKVNLWLIHIITYGVQQWMLDIIPWH